MNNLTPAADPATLSRLLRDKAFDLGFDHLRIAPMGEAPHAAFFARWLEAGRPGAMQSYLAPLSERRRNPVLHSPMRDGAEPFRSVIVLGAHYSAGVNSAALAEDTPVHPGAAFAEIALLDNPAHGRIAAYAWGDDYHDRLRQQVYALDEALRGWSGRTTLGRGLVDTGPVLERDWAAQAGVGFFGKNCCIIHPVYGSWLFLATLLVPERFVYDDVTALHDGDAPSEAVWNGLPADGDYGAWVIPLEPAPAAAGEGAPAERLATCGRCTRCLDGCPTQAFVGPYHLDPQLCISYWTIETQAPIPRGLRPAFGNRIFGCDICQEVCPWNSRLPERRAVRLAFAPQPGHVAPPLLEGFHPATPYWLDDAEFERRFRDSPVLRATRVGMLRNVCVALGNQAAPESISALALALGEQEAGPRGHAAWSLGCLRQRSGDVAADLAAVTAEALLRDRLECEADPWVRDEILAALAA